IPHPVDLGADTLPSTGAETTVYDFRLGERYLAAAFAFVAGFVDSIGFLYLGGVFVSFMSGNTTRSATALVESNWGLATLAGSCILLFLLGVMNGALTQRLATRRWGLYRAREAVLLNVTLMFLISSALVLLEWERAAMLVISIGVGTMNSIFERKGEVAIPLTYMTGTLVKMGQRFVEAFFDGKHIVWILHLALWVSLSAGSIVGALIFHRLQLEAVFIVTGLVFLATVVTIAVRSYRRHHGLPL
ncbi:YoaK family protein, partial [Corynebacterium heidelbergense]|uniref:YoaK family protein n=1 Tax=Corynebacterium heidelbergense TaxID=2055947 RepID=UPI00308382D4